MDAHTQPPPQGAAITTSSCPFPSSQFLHCDQRHTYLFLYVSKARQAPEIPAWLVFFSSADSYLFCDMDKYSFLKKEKKVCETIVCNKRVAGRRPRPCSPVCHHCLATLGLSARHSHPSLHMRFRAPGGS